MCRSFIGCQYFSRRNVLIVAFGCMALTLLSYALTHEPEIDEAAGRVS